MSRVLIIGSVDYTVDNAAMLRVLEVRKAIIDSRREAQIFSMLPVTPARCTELSLPMGGLSTSDEVPGLGGRLMAKIGVGFRCLAHLRPSQTLGFTHIYCYGSGLSWVISAIVLSHRYRGKLIYDITELYDFAGIFDSFSSFRSKIGSWLGIFCFIPLFADSIVVPTSHFRKLFRHLGRSSILLPPFFMDLTPSWFRAREDLLRVTYAGSPGTKEDMGIILKALRNLPVIPDRRIALHIVGLDMEKVEQLLIECECMSLRDRVDLTITAHGRVTVDAARNEVANSDFIIVARKNSIRIRFGFPSKVSEALCLGVPIISNRFSDIGLYDGNSMIGFISQNLDVDGFVKCLSDARALTMDERLESRARAYAVAQEHFSSDAAKRVLESIF